jgi:hypothetical protein
MSCDQVAELALASIQPNKSLFHSRPKSDSMLAQAGTQNSAIEDFVAWNEEAVARCILFTPQVVISSFCYNICLELHRG